MLPPPALINKVNIYVPCVIFKAHTHRRLSNIYLINGKVNILFINWLNSSTIEMSELKFKIPTSKSIHQRKVLILVLCDQHTGFTPMHIEIHTILWVL